MVNRITANMFGLLSMAIKNAPALAINSAINTEMDPLLHTIGAHKDEPMKNMARPIQKVTDRLLRCLFFKDAYIVTKATKKEMAVMHIDTQNRYWFFREMFAHKRSIDVMGRKTK